jgi:serine/threonine-protein kinase
MLRPALDPANGFSPGASGPPYRAGDVIGDRFRVEQVLGCGAMAWVFSATHVQRDAPVALSFLRFGATRQTVARFFPQGRDAARASNEASGRVLDVDRVADGTPFLLMESLEGFELQKMIDEPGWLPVNSAVDFAIQACEGIAVIHGARIVRQNVLRSLSLMGRRTGWIVGKRVVFGVSKLAPASSFTHAQQPGAAAPALARCPVYTSPERMPGAARSGASIDGSADIWSLGVLLYELLGGGCSPFEAATLGEVSSRILFDAPDALSMVRPDLPLGLESVVYRCLEKDPTRRYQDAQSLAIALAPYGSRSGQLRARRLQRSRPQGHGTQPFNPRRSLPPMLSPPRPSSVPPVLPGRTGTVRLLAVAPDPPRAPRAPPTALTTARMPSRPVAPSAPQHARVSRHDLPGLKPPFNVLIACVSVALSALGLLLGTAALAIRAQRVPAPHAVGLAAGVANYMPEALPAPVTIASAPIGAPIAPPVASSVESEHVYVPEELPLVAPSATSAPVRPSGKTAANRLWPDGF